jgi:hypothetical protein
VISLLGHHGIAPERALLFSVCFGLTLAIGSLPGAVAWLVLLRRGQGLQLAQITFAVQCAARIGLPPQSLIWLNWRSSCVNVHPSTANSNDWKQYSLRRSIISSKNV